MGMRVVIRMGRIVMVGMGGGVAGVEGKAGVEGRGGQRLNVSGLRSLTSSCRFYRLIFRLTRILMGRIWNGLLRLLG